LGFARRVPKKSKQGRRVKRYVQMPGHTPSLLGKRRMAYKPTMYRKSTNSSDFPESKRGRLAKVKKKKKKKINTHGAR